MEQTIRHRYEILGICSVDARTTETYTWNHRERKFERGVGDSYATEFATREEADAEWKWLQRTEHADGWLRIVLCEWDDTYDEDGEYVSGEIGRRITLREETR